MVDKEIVKVDEVRGLVKMRDNCITRNADGSWSMILDVDSTVRIDDTRSARFVGELRIKGRQFGRKQRHNPQEIENDERRD